VRLRYTREALADLDGVLDHIVELSPQGAHRVQKRIQTIIDLLLRHPQIG
jgi:plasmid stabilization system protein ParE